VFRAGSLTFKLSIPLLLTAACTAGQKSASDAGGIPEVKPTATSLNGTGLPLDGYLPTSELFNAERPVPAAVAQPNPHVSGA
jgi:hypothetical protein